MSPSAEPLRLSALRQSDINGAAQVFARAFDGDAVARLVTPDAEARRRFQERGGRVQIERAMPFRHVFAVYEGTSVRGIAVWLPPGVHVRAAVLPPPTSWPRIASAVVRNRAAAVRLVRERGRALKAAQATRGWYLAFLATDPSHQRRGIGRRLLEHVLHRADVDGTTVWLETSDPVNVPLYERFGFVSTRQIDGGPALPTFWIMEHGLPHPA